MGRQTPLRDKVGRILGYQETRQDGKIHLYDVVKRELGYYDPKTDQTWQVYPIKKLIGREGNILMTLLENPTI